MSVSESATAFSLTCAGTPDSGIAITLPLRTAQASATAAAELPCGSDLHQHAVAYHQIIVTAERRICHHRQIVLLAPREKITLNAAVIETVRDLIGRAAITVWDTEESSERPLP